MKKSPNYRCNQSCSSLFENAQTLESLSKQGNPLEGGSINMKEIADAADCFQKRISPEEAYKGNFLLAFSFIPMVVDLYNQRKIEEDGLSDTHIWKSFLESRLGSGYKIDWDKTFVSNRQQTPNFSLFLINFSGPYYMGAAKAGCIVCHRLNHKARFFTLECSWGGNIICECIGKNHSNYGILLPDSTDYAPFISQVMKIMNIKGKCPILAYAQLKMFFQHLSRRIQYAVNRLMIF